MTPIESSSRFSALSARLIIAMLIGIVLLVTACGGATPAPTAAPTAAPKKDVTIAYNPCSQQPPWQQGIQTVTLRVAEIQAKNPDYNIHLLINTPAGFNIEEQIKILDGFIAQGANVIIACPLEQEMFPAFAKRANAAGISLGLIFQPEPLAGNANNFGIWYDEEGAFTAEAKMVAEKLGGKGNIMMLRGSQALLVDQVRYKAATAVFATYPGITILGEGEAGWQREPAAKLTQDWISRYGEQMDAILGFNDEMGLGAYQVWKQAFPDRWIPVTGSDATIDGVTSIINGGLFTVVYSNFAGREASAVDNAWAIVSGQGTPKTVVKVPYGVVTKDNAAACLKQIQALESGNKIWGAGEEWPNPYVGPGACG